MAIDDEEDETDQEIGGAVQKKPTASSALTPALLSAAAQLLTGSWGSPVSQFGLALGKAGEAAGAHEQLEQAQQMQQAKLDQAKDLAKLHSDTQLKVAKIHADTMRDITQQRIGAKLSPAAQQVYNKVYGETMKGLQLQILSGQMDHATAHTIADQKALESAGRFNPALAGGAEGAAPAPAAASGTAPTATKMPMDLLAQQPGLADRIEDPAYQRELRKEGYSQAEIQQLLIYLGRDPVGKLLNKLRPKAPVTTSETSIGGG